MKLTRHVFIILIYLIAAAFSKPITLYAHLSSQKIEQLRVLRQTNPALKQQIRLKGQRYQCWKFLENNYIDQEDNEYQVVDTGIDISFFENFGSNLNEKDRALAIKLDRLLSLLHGTCAYHQTNTFIYEFCHLQSVRQFDNLKTYHAANKKYPQDINMGIWNVKQWQKKGINIKYIPKVVQKDGQITQILQWPSLSNVQDQQNNREVAGNRVGFSIPFQYYDDTNVIHFQGPLPLQYSSFITPDCLRITCSTEQGNSILIDGIAIGRYTILPLSKDISRCKSIQTIISDQRQIKYYSPGWHPLRIVDDVLYGDVMGECKYKQTNGQPTDDMLNNERQNYIDINATLILQLEKYPSNDKMYILAKVQDILGENAIRLQAPIGSSYKRNARQEQMSISKVVSCSILTHHSLLADIPIKIEYLGNNVVKIENRRLSNHPAEIPVKADIKIGQQLLALSWVNDGLVAIQMQIIAEIADGYFHVGYKINKNVKKDSQLENTILNNISIVRLFQKLQKIQRNNKNDENDQKSDQKQNKKHRPTKILHLTAKQSIYHFKELPEGVSNRILVISPHPGSIVSVNSDLHSYLLSSSSLHRIKRFPNSSISLLQPDPFYLNNDNNSSYFVYVDQTGNGGIWRLGDQLFIPRLEIRGETIETVEVKGDGAIVRIIQRGKGFENLTISKYNKKMKDSFNFKDIQPVNKPKEETIKIQESSKQEIQEQVILDEDEKLQFPMEISYAYTLGEYCAAPINSFRSTKVTLTCHPSFLTILQIVEPEPCTYHLRVGTRLLCGEGKGWFPLLSEDYRHQIKGGQTICLKDGALNNHKKLKYVKK